MNKLVLFTILVISIKWRTTAQLTIEQLCQGAQDNCRDCLLANPGCSWCADNATASSARCRRSSSTANLCQEGYIQNPSGDTITIRDDNFTIVESYDEDVTENLSIIQLRPQQLDVKLRQGESRKINITFRRVVDYPLDLYYVMDLSYSMRDDLQTLQDLGIGLAADIQNVTRNVNLGFGTFVDKVMMPYASTVPELLENPCQRSQNESCAPVFGFRHQLPLTSNGQLFQNAVSRTEISGNIDSPEGGFDALMQIAVCQRQINWREDALRVIIFTTDASSHIAMDGKLAAILEKNDLTCHLEREENTPWWIYSESKLLDYPSIGQLKRVFEENKIQTIFAVTENVRPLYKDLEVLLDGASVPVLNSNSSNVVDIIREQYNLLSSKIQLNRPSSTSNVGITYRTLCPNGANPFWVPNSLECDNVRIGDEVSFEFELTALRCPPNPQQIDSINITSASILDRTLLRVEYVSCQCNCSEDRRENSSSCSGSGVFECGLCYCNEGATGQQCQCTALSSGEALEAKCTSDPDNYTPGNELCNDRGPCECGVCSCNEGFFGMTCECSRTGCPLECGGPNQGNCENCNGDKKCNCHTNLGWTLNPETGDCSCNDDICRPPNATEVCSGKGTCECNVCACQSFLSGRYCTQCDHPRCTGITDGCSGSELQKCAECVYETERRSGTSASECEAVCTQTGIGYESVKDILDCTTCKSTLSCDDECRTLSNNRTVHVPQLCRSTHVDTECEVTYKIFWDTGVQPPRFLVQVLEHDSEDCPGPINPLLIVLPVVGGIVLLGLLALILWKIFQTIRDKHEYQQFVEEAKQSQWTPNENPLFEKPTDRIENPAYIGAN